MLLLLLFFESDVVDLGRCSGIRFDIDDGLNLCVRVLSLSSSAFNKFCANKKERKKDEKYELTYTSVEHSYF